VGPADASLSVHPGQTPFNWLAHYQLDNALLQAAREHARGRLVDIGCGLKPYKETFAPHVSEHVGVDHPDSPHARTAVDVAATAYDIPLPDSSFETALMSEVLEHLEHPLGALVEALRLLAPGGKLILTTPFVWVLHEEPRDFFRYTPHGLRALLSEAGFVDVSVVPVSGQWGTLSLMGSYVLSHSRAARLPRTIGLAALISQRVALWLDRRRPTEWLSWNHIVVATRPACD
jgi:ubiquinone/menaquinone biosynthesis C-methylase UbiE